VVIALLDLIGFSLLLLVQSVALQVHLEVALSEMLLREHPLLLLIAIDLDSSGLVNLLKKKKCKGYEEMLKYLNDNRPKNEQVVTLWDGRLGGTMLASYISTPTMKNLHSVKTMEVECGRSKTTIKGAVCLRFCIGDKSLSFGSVHLTADQETDNTEARIQDFHKINAAHFDNCGFSDHDLVCIMGDLNFRVNLDRQEIVKLSEQKNFQKIMQYYQLLVAKREGKAFVEYTEGPVNFPPTYKYYNGSNQYNLSEPPHKRSPAYTKQKQWTNCSTA